MQPISLAALTYLTPGVLIASYVASMFLVIRKDTDRQLRAELDDLTRNFPGGERGIVLALVILWPALLALAWHRRHNR